MKVSEALRIIQGSPADAASFDVLLACGFTPLHLRTFFHAHLAQRLPQRKVQVREGLYGDLAGTLERASGGGLHGVCVLLEWADLDPRLGFRSAGVWDASAVRAIPSLVVAALDRVALAILGLESGVRVVVCPPTLPLPPMFLTVGAQASATQLELEAALSGFLVRVSARQGLAVADARGLVEAFSPDQRHDIRSELLIGFPYPTAFASSLGQVCAALMSPPPPKKGIITDLDDTLWDGIAGEVGPQGVSWELGQHSHLHALYQKLLGSLSSQGALVGVASKNDPEVVKEAFSRADILLRPDQVFPFEVHWQPKSQSVTRILKEWNIGAGDVVFVDDSPMELAEVEAAHPGITCLRFSKGDYPATIALLRKIRDMFGKESLTREDSLRTESIRQGAEFRKLAEGGSVSDGFLEAAGAKITFDLSPSAGDSRVLELVNKTNQFNLNGLRRKDADWLQATQAAGAVTAVMSYEDKFGPLGKIAVLQGQMNGAVLQVSTWVMSCRAFARRIEHQCLKVLFERSGASEIQFDFVPTPRNGPTLEFLTSILGAAPTGPVSLSKEQFGQACPALYHQVVIADSVERGEQ